MIHGSELAAKIGEALDAVEAFVITPPCMTARIPFIGAMLAIRRGTVTHWLANADVWKLQVSPPPSLACDAQREFRWHEGPQLKQQIEALQQWIDAWWTQPQLIGVLDVIGVLASMGLSIMTDSPQRAYASPNRRWPLFFDVQEEDGAIAIYRIERPKLLVKTVDELRAALPQLVESAQHSQALCSEREQRFEKVHAEAQRRFADWTLQPRLLELSLREPVAAYLTKPDVRLALYDDGRIQVGPWFVEESQVAEAAIREQHRLAPWKLCEGRSYRLKRALKELPPGALVRFTCVTEVRPSGEDAYFFDHLTLLSEKDKAVLDELDGYLEPA